MKAIPPLVVHWEEFIDWLYQRTATFPKKARFTFAIALTI